MCTTHFEDLCGIGMGIIAHQAILHSVDDLIAEINTPLCIELTSLVDSNSFFSSTISLERSHIYIQQLSTTALSPLGSACCIPLLCS